MLRSIVALVLLQPMFVSTAAQAQSCNPFPSGIVVDLVGNPEGYELLRAGRRIQLGFYFELRGGDELRLAQSDLRLSVQRADGRIEHANRQGSRYCISQGQRRYWWDNAWMMAGELLTNVRRGIVSLNTRGDDAFELTPRSLTDRRAAIFAGTRSLSIFWQGGTAPFLVEVEDSDARPLVRESGLFSRFLRLSDPRDLKPGDYTVRITDNRGKTLLGGFHASGDVAFSAPETPEEAMASAGALLSQVPPRDFDALLVLSPFYGRHASVTELVTMLTLRN